MRTIKLMTDYQCFPLWEASPGSAGNIDPAELPISAPLCGRLLAWASVFDATLDMDDPASSGFPDVQALEEFTNEGIALQKLLQNELGESYRIIYTQIGGVRS